MAFQFNFTRRLYAMWLARLPVLIVWVSACSGASVTQRVSITDSAGVVIIDSNAPRVLNPPYSLGTPTVSIGGAGSGELNQVVGAVRLSDGRIVIADGGNAAVQYYSPEGRLLASVGRKGDGPSEFRILQAIGKIWGDTVWVYDFSHHRVTFIAPDASVVGEVSVRSPAASALAVGILPDSTMVFGESWSSARVATATQRGLNREPVAYLRFSGAGELIDTVGLFLGREVLLDLENGRAVMSAAPMGRSAVHSLSGATLAIGDQVRHEIRFFTPSGELKRIVRWNAGDLAMDPELEAAWRESRLASVPSAEKAAAARELAKQPLPAHRPAYGQILPTQTGGLWVASYSIDEPRTWAVFDSVGEWYGSVNVPPRFQPLEIGGEWVLGVTRDELDVQRVELRALSARD